MRMTSYDMRNSNGSSDVCSSDLGLHAGVGEARLAPLRALEHLVAAVQLVDLADPAHADAVAVVVIEVAQPVVEVLRAEIARAVQELAVAFNEFPVALAARAVRSEEHTSELQSPIRTSYAGFCLTTHTIQNHANI